MQLIDNKQKRLGVFVILFNKALSLLGNKRFYPEIQQIEDKVNHGMPVQSHSPTNWQALGGLLELLKAVIRRLYHKTFWLDQWYLLYSFKTGSLDSLNEFNKILPPGDRFWADPHIIAKDDKFYVFIEEYVFRTQKTCLSVMEIDEAKKHTNPVPILETNYHVSYPCVFRYGDTYYLVPETAENKSIDLYECTEFPYKWRFVIHLMRDVTAVDTTLFYYSDKWWLFTAIPEIHDSLPKVKLFLFYSDTLITDTWKPHSQNPIVNNSYTSRPAGKIFIEDNKIYRPSQDCSHNYGYGININEITQLSENDYAEKRVSSIKPGWDNTIKGTHTYNNEGRLTVIDGYRRLPRFINKD